MAGPDVVTIAEVRHVAALARLGLTDERALELTRDLNTILEHMAVLGQLDTRGVAEASGFGADGMRLRRDQGAPVPLSAPVGSFAPELRDGLFVVPRLATHEDAEPA